MNDFTVHEFEFDSLDPNGGQGPWKLSTVVMNDEEFDSLMSFIDQSMQGTFNRDGIRMGNEQVQALREARHIPMISRGTKTKVVFERYGISSNFMSVIVRGHGLTLLEKLTRGEARGQA